MLTLPRALRRPGRALPWWVAALLLAVVAGGCAKRDAESSSPMMDAGGGAEASLADLERALADEESRLRSAGVALPAPTRAPALAGAANDEALASESGAAEESPSAPSVAEESPSAPSEAESVAVSTGSTGRDRRGERRRCESVCDLAGSICGLGDHICGLAARHPGDGRYAQVCQRATGDCRAASEACDGCE